MKQMRYVIIGMTDDGQPRFSEEVRRLIACSHVFSGGRRHHELVAELLPDDAEWIDITVPLDSVFSQYREAFERMENNVNGETGKQIVIFASGDPLFYGFANTVRRYCPDAKITLYPAFNSLQMLAHRLVMPYHDMRIVSLTGRPWHEFDRAVIERTAKIGILTDREHTPAAIAARLIEYGYDGYRMYLGEHLGSSTKEKITDMSLGEAVGYEADYPNCLILERDCQGGADAKSVRRFGIPESEFALLDGRAKMITKMPVRIVTLQSLELYAHDLLIDVGYCTGSVSIEAKLQFPHLSVLSFEVRPECAAVMSTNARRFGALGINAITADFMDYSIADLEDIYRRDTGRTNPRKSFFIGGHNGQLTMMMTKINEVLREGDVIVMNSVTAGSRSMFEESAARLGLRLCPPLTITLDGFNPISIMKCVK